MMCSMCECFWWASEDIVRKITMKGSFQIDMSWTNPVTVEVICRLQEQQKQGVLGITRGTENKGDRAHGDKKNMSFNTTLS